MNQYNENFLSVNNKEYQIIRLLGKGKGGYSYLAADDKQQYVSEHCK